ncbi:F0F1 ATP synthase subunit gamma [Mycoplasma synoviae GX11-T]|nr:ATP synthase F1 subunit gamma [Mycoplasmopsis synoviae]MBD5788705.1 F0F1 ATP synthase subunit gamma [Mycoplasmopsis synoviae GX11-T]
MSNLINIKNRINVVTNTRKITNAMQLVSTSKLHRIINLTKNIKTYQNLVETTFDNIVSKITQEELNEIFPPKQETDATLYIIVTSDIGLCGSYNSNVINELKKVIKPSDLVITLGTKGLNWIRVFKFKDQLYKSYVNLEDKLDYSIATEIGNLNFELFAKNKISSCKIIYTKFVNNLIQEVSVKQLFPYDSSHLEIKKESEQMEGDIEFEPSAEIILQRAFPLYVSSMIYVLVSLSKVSELASRRVAMESATDNADEIISDLNLEYNSKRQSVITQEITEIVAGAQATN